MQAGVGGGFVLEWIRKPTAMESRALENAGGCEGRFCVDPRAAMERWSRVERPGGGGTHRVAVSR
jgi:hypothetical protein